MSRKDKWVKMIKKWDAYDGGLKVLVKGCISCSFMCGCVFGAICIFRRINTGTRQVDPGVGSSTSNLTNGSSIPGEFD